MSIASSGSVLLVFSEDETDSRMNSEVNREILSNQIQLNAAKLIGWRFIIQMNDDPKHTAKSTQEYNILQWPSPSPDLNLIELHFTRWRQN